MNTKVVWLAALLSVAAIVPVAAQTRIVTGRVTDSLTSDLVTSGQVSVSGTTVGTTIKDDGTFTIGVPARDVVLSIRSIGFKRKDVPVPTSESSLAISLARDYFQLEAIVVTGQATGVERKNLANAVSTVSAAQLGTVPVASVDQALVGKLAGAQINQSSGAPGSTARVSLRGITTINGNNTPLYVIDGVLASDVAIPRGTNFITQAARGTSIARTGENSVTRIADINPQDIESVEVLEGASAAAMYGSKAANGVIIITTKRGRVGAPQFEITQKFGSAYVMRKRGYRVLQSLADAQAIWGPSASDPVTGWKPGQQLFDNEGVLTGTHPLNYETNFSLSGGTETTQYFASLLVNHTGGIIKPTYNDKRALRLNVDQSAMQNRVKLSLGAQVTNSADDQGLTINENNNSSYYASLLNTPSFFDLRGTCSGTRTTKAFCPDGSLAVYTDPFVQSNALQTAARLQNPEQVWRTIGTGQLNVDLISTSHNTLRFLGNGGVDFFNQQNDVTSPPDLLFESLDGQLGTFVASGSNNLNYNVGANLVHTLKTDGGSSFTTQAGMQYLTTRLETNRILAANLIGGLPLASSGTQTLVNGQIQYVKDFGLFGQEEFLTLNERLLLTAGIRADQSSNNSDPTKVFYYPKFAASYRIPNISHGFLNEVKLRGAFGESGNEPQYGQKFTELQGLNVAGVPAAQIGTAFATPNLTPERQAEFEGGFDANFVGGRLNLEVTGYQKRITNLIVARSLPTAIGFSQEFLNGGTLTTRGLEVALNGVPVQTRNLSLSGRLAFHMYRSKIDSLGVPQFGGCGFGGGSIRIQQGGSATAVWGQDTLANGTTTCVKIGESRPDYQLQFSSDIKFKALSLNAVLDRSKGGLISDLTGWIADLDGTSADYDAPAPDGTKLGLYRTAMFNRVSRIWVQDASYLKLREVSLSLDLPNRLVRSVFSGARFVRLSVSGRNLFIWTKYTGSDPEARWVAENNLSQAMPQELEAYPQSRQFWLSASVGF